MSNRFTSQSQTQSAQAQATYIPGPDKHPKRTLVVCLDGTGAKFGHKNSNVIQFFEAIKKDDPTQQMVYYQPGLGTWPARQFITKIATKVSETLDQLVALHLGDHIMSAYRFLMENYRAGDRICIFGFSRGAYTSVCLAGMIHKVGLLPVGNEKQVPFAYDLYKNDTNDGWEQSNVFKQTYSIDVDIEFVGVWDTVNSVGFIPRRLPLTKSNKCVKTFRHAMALDERRAKFKVQQWARATEGQELLSATDARIQEAVDAGTTSKAAKTKTSVSTIQDIEERYAGRDLRQDTSVLEVWFAGDHTDIGGGHVENGTKNSLAYIPLRWMVRECFRTETGILFNRTSLEKLGLTADSLLAEPKYNRPARIRPDPAKDFIRRSRSDPAPPQFSPTTADANGNIAEAPPVTVAANSQTNTPAQNGTAPKGPNPFDTEEECELKDSLSPIHDQLTDNRWWWILEWIPLRVKVINDIAPDEVPQLRVNRGKGRVIPDPNIKDLYVHRSVRTRMAAKYEDGAGYLPRAEFQESQVKKWIDEV